MLPKETPALWRAIISALRGKKYARGFLEKRRYSTLSKATNTSVYFTNNLKLQDSDILAIKSGKMILRTCDSRDSFLQHRLPKTKEKNYSDLQNLDCSKKGLRKFINNKEKCWNSGGSTTGTLPILWVKYATSELGKYTTFTLQGDGH